MAFRFHSGQGGADRFGECFECGARILLIANTTHAILCADKTGRSTVQENSAAVQEAKLLIAEAKADKAKHLSLAGLRLQSLPAAVAELGHLQSLDLSGCWPLHDLAALSGLGALQSLNLSGCPALHDLAPLSGLGALQSLDLSRCSELHDLAPLSGLGALQSLDLSRCSELRDLAPLSGLGALQSLDLSWCPELHDLAPLSGLGALQSLDLSWCSELRDLAPLSGLGTLQSLDLSWCSELRDLAPLSGLGALQSLDLRRCSELRDLAPLSGLGALQSLDLSWCPELRDLAPLSGLGALQSLDLCGCPELRDLAPLSGLGALQSLDLSQYPELRDLAALSGLGALQSLDLSGCPELRDLAPLSGLGALQSLDLSGCDELRDLAPLSGLGALQSLNLGWCPELRDLAPLSGLGALQSLDLSGCPELRDLAPLSGLGALQSLNLSECPELCDLAPLSGLGALQSLYLGRCPELRDLAPLAHSPRLENLFLNGSCNIEFFNRAWFTDGLPRLQTLTLDGGRGLPTEILAQSHLNSLPAVCRWADDLQHGCATVDEIKLLVLGNGRAGKTQLARRLTGKAFDGSVPSTHGIVLDEFEVLPKGSEKAGIQARLWDFGGQDVYLGTHRLFMDERAVYLLVWASDTENDAEVDDGALMVQNRRLPYWLAYIRSLAGSAAPVIVAQSKCDSELQVLEAPVPATHGFERMARTACSAVSEAGLERLLPELRSAVRYHRERFSDVLLPLSWLKVRDALRERKVAGEKFLSKAEYESMCNEPHHRVNAPETLLSYLHGSGEVFWRANVFDSRLVLDQAWALEGVYALQQRSKVIPFLKRHLGRFTASDLGDLIWNEKFSPTEQGLFLELMQQCGVCFNVGEGHFIAPDCLPPRAEVQAKETREWRGCTPDASVRLIYGFLHDGTMRSILGAIGKRAGADAVFWRYGCCVFDGNKGLGLRVCCELDKGDEAMGQAGSVLMEAAGPGARELLEHLVDSIQRSHTGGTMPQVARECGNELVQPVDTPGAERDKTLAPFRNVPSSRPTPNSARTTVYVSYAWGGESEELVNGLEQQLMHSVDFRRDRSTLKTGDSIRQFELEIGRAPTVMVVLSAKYMRSVDCMRELIFLYQHSQNVGENFVQRVIPLVLGDASISKPADRLAHAQHWIAEHETLANLVDKVGVANCGQTTVRELQDMAGFKAQLVDALSWLADTVMPRGAERLSADNYEAVIELFYRRLGLSR